MDCIPIQFAMLPAEILEQCFKLFKCSRTAVSGRFQVWFACTLRPLCAFPQATGGYAAGSRGQEKVTAKATALELEAPMILKHLLEYTQLEYIVSQLSIAENDATPCQPQHHALRINASGGQARSDSTRVWVGPTRGLHVLALRPSVLEMEHRY